MDEAPVVCEVCGEVATRYISSIPICDCVTCYTLRLEMIQELISKMNKEME